MKHNIETDDIRWWNVASQRRISYLESLKAQIERGNSWIYMYEWDELKQRLPVMTEDQAKIQLFRITNLITERVEENKMRYD